MNRIPHQAKESLVKEASLICRQVRDRMRCPVPLVDCSPTPFLWNPTVRASLTRLLSFEGGGVQVLAAPPASGKSTYLRCAINEYISQPDKHAVVLGSELTRREEFFERFGGADRAMDLFDHLPPSSVILFDQIDAVELNTEMKNLLRHCAIESRRTLTCNVIVCVSSVDKAKEILDLNGLDKFRQWGKAEDFQWDEMLLREGIARANIPSHWSKGKRDLLFECACQAKSIGFLRSAIIFDDEESWGELAECEAIQWEEFKKGDL